MVTIGSHLDWARAGNREAALEGLIGLGEPAIPRLADAFRTEPDPALRALLVETVRQLRSHASIELLGEALRDPSPEVWKQALDGLVTLASPESLRILEASRDVVRVPDEDFAEWLEGAIEDVRGRIDE
jgi:HEAT repeat protein